MILAVNHIYQPLNPIFINFGPVVIYKYAIMILIGILVALYLGIKEGKRIGVNHNIITDGLIIILPLSLLGARLWYIMFDGAHNFRHFFPFAGLAIHGGVIVAVISTYIFAKKKGIDFLKLTDLLAPGLLIGQAMGRWGNFFNQEAHGGIIGGVDAIGNPNLTLDSQRSFLSSTLKLPEFIVNQMYGSSYLANNAYYHPTFLYESIWNLI
ncbi:MAG: prolipoprotein diacylglyceryl transferase, partial [Candidatus Izemoplasmataceae bacterium]